MALKWGDRVLETSTSTGTGAFTLAGAITGFQRFSAVCSTSDTIYYSIFAVDANGTPTGEWETGLGTYSGTNTLTRTTPLASTNSGSAVSFAAGTKWVIASPAAAIQPTAVALTLLAQTTQSAMRSTGLGLGTSATVDTGTSGTKVALTDGANTWSAAQTDSALATFSAGANLTPASSPATNAVGYLGVPVNSQSTAYTTVMSDVGKMILHPSTDANARTFTIDSNANVAYPIGTILTFCNMTSQVVTIAITSDTLYLAGAGTTGSRSLAQYGVATAVKLTSTTWLISGSGLT
jgi:hypothetical protein